MQALWPHPQASAGGGRCGHACRLSYVALCYCLLHEEDFGLQSALQGLPGALAAAKEGGLPALQDLLWGFLDADGQ